jgi:hypothetical protein
MDFKNTSLIITSISVPNRAMKLFAEASKKRGIEFIVIGDEISPADFKLDGCRFYSIDEQKNLPFKLAKILPTRHYSRKNLGYLLSAHQDIILETDDDNIPRDNFWETRNRNVTSKHIENNGWTNIYSYFTDEKIWPRGFPLEYIADKKKNVADPTEEAISPIQQGLADENPDVDAIYRMCMKLPITFTNHQPITLGKNSWCPFNSQNTTWFSEAFPLLYLPSYCSFRMTDIWRSFIAQRIAWTCGWKILFHGPSVWQERNEHSLIKDFEDEVQGYLCNSKICALLGDLDLKDGIKNIHDNMIRCYNALVKNEYLLSDEMKLLEAWLTDIKNIQS